MDQPPESGIGRGSSGDVLVTYSFVQGGWPGEGNSSLSPLISGIVNPHLTLSSPCIDAGAPPATVIPAADIDGEPRKHCGAVDVGADEVIEVGCSHFARGDCNTDSHLDIADGIYLVFWLFEGAATPPCLTACDADDNDQVGIGDAIFLFGYQFQAGPPPPPPFPHCGVEPTTGTLTCNNVHLCP